VAAKRSVRGLVLAAAVALIESDGVATLTLEAVAAKAGVSKGGLLHYFRSKEALLTAVIQHHVEAHEAGWRSAAMGSGDGAAAEADLIKGYLQRSFDGTATASLSARALFGIAAFHPALLQPVKDYFKRRAEQVRRMRHPQQVLAFMLMADGLSLFDALGTPPVTGALRTAVHDLAQNMARAALANGAGYAAGVPAAAPGGTSKIRSRASRRGLQQGRI
jgi:AcrR family transcriptional regulator